MNTLIFLKPKILIPTQSTNSIKGTDCDCACEPASQHIQHKFLPSMQWKTSKINFLASKTDAEYQTVSLPESSVSAMLVNQDAVELLSAFEIPTTLEKVIQRYKEYYDIDVSLLTHQMAEYGLIKPYSEIPIALSGGEPIVLSAWLHITDRCNLRCTYCYLPHVREDMSLETGKEAIDALFRSAQANKFKQVKLKYAGGEPLLKFDLVVKLHTYAQETCKNYGVEKVEGIVLSNGTLLNLEMIEKMKLLKLRLMISLDGMGQYHDSHRPYAGGRGSFKDVCDGIELAIANDLKPNISVTISSRTADGLSEVMGFILKHDLQFSLNFYRENELSASHEDMRIDEAKIINGMLSAFKEIEKDIPRNSFLGGIVDRANLSAAHTHTCGVGQSYLVFDQNGQVAKCQMHIRKPITNIHVADPLAVIRADQTGIQNLPVLEKEGCKTCEWKDFCTGGCPLATFRATGRYDVKSPNCNIYKALFPEAMRLEGLRLLKYQNDPEVVVQL